MKRTRSSWLGMVAAISLLASSCVMPLNASRGIALSVLVELPQGDLSPRYALVDLGSWTLSGEGPEGSSFSETYASSETQAQVKGLVPGAWTLRVEASDSLGALLLTGTASAELLAGEPNAVTIPLLDANSLQVTLSFAVPEHPALTAVNLTDGASLDIQNNVVVFDSMASTSVNLQVSAGFDSYEWYIDGVWESTLSGSPECLLAGSGTVLTGWSTTTILVVVTKGGQSYSQEFWVLDQGMKG